MTPSFILVLVITGGVISATGLLASWVIRFEKIKFFLNSSSVISDAPQTERTILADTLTVAEGLSKAQTHTNLPEPTSMKSESRVTSGSSAVPRASSAVAVVEPSWKTTAETATVTAAGSQETTAEGRVTSPETVKMETSRNKAQTSPIKPEKSLTNIVPTYKKEADATKLIQTTEAGSTTAKKDSPTTKAETVVTCFTEIVTTADIKSASPIPEPVTDEATKPVTRITSESKETTKAGSEDTFSMTISTTETNTGEPDVPVHITTEKVVPGTGEKLREPSKVETTTVRPKESTHARKISDSSTIMNRANSIQHTTTIATTTGTTENTDKKQLTITAADTSLTKTNVLITTIKSRFTSRSSPHISTADLNGLNTVSPVRPSVTVFYKFTQSHKTLSPCKGKCKSKSTAKIPAGRQDNEKVPLTYNKTLYSAITMGCILVLCSILAFIVFIKDLVV